MLHAALNRKPNACVQSVKPNPLYNTAESSTSTVPGRPGRPLSLFLSPACPPQPLPTHYGSASLCFPARNARAKR
eukprot:43403-Pelagomonas_calceolata.AAC.2